MTARLYFDSQNNGKQFLDQKNCAQLAQWVFNITNDRDHFNTILKSNLRGRHFLARLDNNGLDDLLMDLGIQGSDLEEIKTNVADAKAAIIEAHSDHETKAIVAKWREQILLITSNNPIYSVLDMPGRDMGNDGVELITEAMRQNEIINSVDLSGNGISHAGVRCLEKMLRTNTSITHLDVGGNKLGPRGVTCLVAALKPHTAHKCNRTIRSLVLRNNNITSSGAKAVGHALSYNANLDMHSNIQSLDVWGNSLRTEGGRHMGEMLNRNFTLTTLDLSNNAIGTSGMSHVAEAITTNTTLTSLNLWNSWEGAEGYIMLAGALTMNSTLTSLGLNGNKGGSTGVRVLVDSLTSPSHPSVTALDLTDNGIESRGARSLARLLRRNCSLTQLKCSNNSLRDEGVGRIASALDWDLAAHSTAYAYGVCEGEGKEGEAKEEEEEEEDSYGRLAKGNMIVTDLDLSANEVTLKGARVLAIGLQANRSLTNLNLGANHVMLGGVEAMSSLLRKGDDEDGNEDNRRGGQDGSGDESVDSDFDDLRGNKNTFGVRRQSGCALAGLSFGFNGI